MAQQSLVGTTLQAALNDPSQSTLRVDVVLAEQTDLMALKAQFERTHTPVEQRAKSVIRQLQTTANQTQPALIAAMEGFEAQHPASLLELKQLWVTNLLIVEGSPELIRMLCQRSDIYYIDLSSARTVRPVDDPKSHLFFGEKGPGGREPGLDSVGAPAMWARGYTGRGRTCFNLDTGIWEDHPAFASRFLAHHFPFAQTWYGYDAVRPLDKEGSHGTHTLGTSIGLDPVTADTIGVAFNARWIASDPVATSLATVKPLSDFMFAFEWSLNPDGDTSTTSDIPDVINNSWGYSSPGDTALCFSYVSLVFDAVEAAGIANVFSAGNDGPTIGSISEPHHISTGLVNTFTVGAVNHYQNGSPIAGFSSRGPTNCPATGSLQIKPEVVAPGVNVRSAVGHLGYASYQGTSMAAPHVTGCVLLLKEAFPGVTGQEILEAIYFSAQDMGVAGEDNTFGMGMIDVDQAYLYLAQTHTPTLPIYSNQDIDIESILGLPTQFLCEGSIEPTVVLHNGGDTVITTSEIRYGFVGQPSMVLPHVQTLQPGDAAAVPLGMIPVTLTGELEFQTEVVTVSGTVESDLVNNRRIGRFNRRANVTVPFLETFDTDALGESDWYVETYDVNITWDTAAAGGLSGSTASAFMDFPGYSPKAWQEDDLISPLIALPDTGDLAFRFHYAYQHRINVFSDSLRISISTDCGNSWDQIWYKGGRDLTTHTDVTARFVPSLAEHWKTGGADLSNYVGSGEAMLKFTTVNSLGNYLFIDSVEVYKGAAPVGISADQSGTFELFPNPNQGEAVLRWEGNTENQFSCKIVNLLGIKVREYPNLTGNRGSVQIDLKDLPQGVYVAYISSAFNSKTIKLLKQ